MINTTDCEKLMRKTFGLKAVEFNSIVVGQYYKYKYFNLRHTFNTTQKYIKVIHIYTLGKGMQTIEGYRQEYAITTLNPGVWYAKFNLDVSRNKLTPITLKNDNLSFMPQSDYGLRWVLSNIPNNITDLA